GLMMLVVMEFERVRRHVRTEGVIILGQFWKRKGHGVSPLIRVGRMGLRNRAVLRSALKSKQVASKAVPIWTPVGTWTNARRLVVATRANAAGRCAPSPEGIPMSS